MFRYLMAHHKGVQYKNWFKVSENRALRRISRPNGKEVPEGSRTLKMRCFIICVLLQILLRVQITDREMGRQIAQVGYLRNAYSVSLVSHKKRNHLSELDVDMRIILK